MNPRIINDDIELKAKQCMEEGIKPMDALHLASAIEVKVDYFCTTDDKLLKKAKKISAALTKITSPLELIMEIAK